MNFYAGSSMILLADTKIYGSIDLPLKLIILSKNYWGLFMTYWDFFHNLSSGSEMVIFSPNNISTALAVVSTPVGGEPRDFISVI